MKKYILFYIIIVMAISCSSNNKSGITDSYILPDSIKIVQGNGKVLPLNGILNIASQINGNIAKIYVSSGQSVSKGDTIAVISADNNYIESLSAKDKLQQQEANISLAQIALEKSELDLEIIKKEVLRDRELYKQSAETLDNLTQKENQEKKQILVVEENKNKLKLAKLQLKELQDQQQIANNNYKNSIITAPTNGRILDVLVDKGVTLRAYEIIATFSANEPKVVEAEVDELFASKLKIGQKVIIHPLGYSEVIGKGEIYQMNDFLSNKSIFTSQSGEYKDRQTRKIHIKLTEGSNNIILGTKVICDITI